jgi:glycosyltransferase involved in cell wall biosynthesis
VAQKIDPRDVDLSRVSVVIPAMNEADNLRYVFERIPEGIHELILVDGASTDNTVLIAQALWPAVKIVRQTRRGKGNALACGFAAATGEIIVMIDADGSTDPAEIPAFVAALHAGSDFAKGTRFAPGGGSNDITTLRRYGNKALNVLVNTVCDTRFTDLCYGYNAFWRRLLPVIALEPGEESHAKRLGDGFEVETLINIRLARAHVNITEVPSFERGRLHGASNLNAFSDGFRVLRTIACERRARRTLPASGVLSAKPSYVEQSAVVDLTTHDSVLDIDAVGTSRAILPQRRPAPREVV